MVLPAPPTRITTMSHPPEGVGVALKEGVTLALPDSVPERDTTERVEVVEGLEVAVSERAAEGDAKLRVAEAHWEAEREAAPLREVAGEALTQAEVDTVRLPRAEAVLVVQALLRAEAPLASADTDSEGEAEGEPDSDTASVGGGARVSEGLPVAEGEGGGEGDAEALPLGSGE